MFVARGVRNKVLYREARPEIKTLILLYTIFDKKRYPFDTPSQERMNSFSLDPV